MEEFSRRATSVAVALPIPPTELAELSDTLWGLLQIQNSLQFVNLGHESSVREQADTLFQASGCDTGGLFQNFQATFGQNSSKVLFLDMPVGGRKNVENKNLVIGQGKR